MGKNNAFIEQQKRLQKQINSVTPQVYAGIALALKRRYGWGYKRINDLFTESQRIWAECTNSDKRMTEMCEEETGIDVVYRVNEKVDY